MTDRNRFLAACCAAFLLILAPAYSGERATAELAHDRTFGPGQGVRIENLIGSITVTGGGDPGIVKIEADVVAEADDSAEAQGLAGAVTLDESESDGTVVIRVGFPVDDHTAFKVPRSELDGVMAKWVNPLIKKKTVATEYGGRSVELGPAKGATQIAVHVRVTLPRDVEGSFKQYLGSLDVKRLRGATKVEVVQGQATAAQLYGTLAARLSGGTMTVKSFHGTSLDVHTGSGDVELIDVASDEIRLRSGSGVIGGHRVTTQALHVDTDSGPIRLTEVEPRHVEIESDTAPVDLTTHLRTTRNASIRSGSGNITLRIGDVTPFELDGDTDSGSVKAKGLKVDVLEESKNDAVIRRGKGGVALKVESDSGNVLVRAM